MSAYYKITLIFEDDQGRQFTQRVLTCPDKDPEISLVQRTMQAAEWLFLDMFCSLGKIEQRPYKRRFKLKDIRNG